MDIVLKLIYGFVFVLITCILFQCTTITKTLKKRNSTSLTLYGRMLLFGNIVSLKPLYIFENGHEEIIEFSIIKITYFEHKSMHLNRFISSNQDILSREKLLVFFFFTPIISRDNKVDNSTYPNNRKQTCCQKATSGRRRERYIIQIIVCILKV